MPDGIRLALGFGMDAIGSNLAACRWWCPPRYTPADLVQPGPADPPPVSAAPPTAETGGRNAESKGPGILPKIGDVPPPEPIAPPAPAVREEQVVRRVVGTGRLIDLVI